MSEAKRVRTVTRCEHDRILYACPECSPAQLLGKRNAQRVAVLHRKHGIERAHSDPIYYLGCDLEFFKWFIEQLFVNGMSWSNYGEWRVKRIAERTCDTSSDEGICRYLNFTNFRPSY